MNQRLVVPVLATVLATVVTALGGGAAQAAAPAETPKADFLTSNQIAKALDGKFALRWTEGNSADRVYAGCRSLDNAPYVPARSLYAANARYGEFTQMVVDKKTVARAKAYVAMMAKVSHCSTVTMGNYKQPVREMPIPAVGNQRAAYRINFGNNSVFDYYYVRKGSSVVSVAYRWDPRPTKSEAATLIRQAVARA